MIVTDMAMFCKIPINMEMILINVAMILINLAMIPINVLFPSRLSLRPVRPRRNLFGYEPPFYI